GYSMKGGDFSWPPVGTFRGHQRGPQLATSRYFLMATDIISTILENHSKSPFGRPGASRPSSPGKGLDDTKVKNDLI
ncbi:MAG: hypothetical protein ACYCPT_11795, partial [Acidimicrobiales bacterium]